jgi:hypothetical protein
MPTNRQQTQSFDPPKSNSSSLLPTLLAGEEEENREISIKAAPLSQLDTTTLLNVLHSRRKRPLQRVCRSCHLRKVKCNYGLPCQTCNKRGHPELCTYAAGQPHKRAKSEGSADSVPPASNHRDRLPSKEGWQILRDLIAVNNQSIQELKEEFCQFRAEFNQRHATLPSPKYLLADSAPASPDKVNYMYLGK